MATVELLFSALPEHVRTARLVAAAVARRAGVDEAVLDEVRLAVGEACSRAVGLHVSHGIGSPVRVVLTEDEKKFSIEVADDAPHAVVVEATAGARAGSVGAGSGAAVPAAEEGAEGEDDMGLAVISGLVDDVEVSADETGGHIRMSWPTTPAPALS
ncbi:MULTISPECIES: ATP-binding protein [Streptomyces]|uniref:ATP-binding protein n=1 Tax=Streptomyces morookaense TaxID=1970 RepID=A0A7Y7E9B7_STRMO|nr:MULTISPECIES: ATP-binding protein [Streptomyces]MCC2274709.1 ATP-binding protein [Streptomyces sp. ET3-23]NVK80895.1 ATP-binding protein [Streptomyces morookaense]GHF28745.1 anti-sigma regulatory factor [Streptomyces morookaense]